jgi:hypothetical protein
VGFYGRFRPTLATISNLNESIDMHILPGLKTEVQTPRPSHGCGNAADGGIISTGDALESHDLTDHQWIAGLVPIPLPARVSNPTCTIKCFGFTLSDGHDEGEKVTRAIISLLNHKGGGRVTPTRP